MGGAIYLCPMYRAPALLQLCDRSFVVRLLLLLLLLAIPVIGDGFLLLMLADRCGRYLALAIAASTGLISLFFLINSLSSTLRKMQLRVAAAEFPARQYHELTALVTAAVLLLLPGLLTDLLGLLFYLPLFRSLLGALICLPFRRRLAEVYEYQKLIDE